MKDKLIVAILLYPNSKYVQNNNNEFNFFLSGKVKKTPKYISVSKIQQSILYLTHMWVFVRLCHSNGACMC